MSAKNNSSHKKSHKVTIVDVANESGVSYSTVSRVLNGFEHVKDSTRQRVLATAERLGYVANLQARSLAGGKTNIIGILVPGLDNGYIGEIVRGADEELLRSGYNMVLYTTHRLEGKESTYVKSIYNRMCEGLILVVPITHSTYLDTLQQQKFPYVLVDQIDASGKSNIVDSTNWQGAYDATNHLITLGHRKIAHISGLIELGSSIDRRDGYLSALHDNNIAVNPDYIVAGDYYQSSGYEAMEQLLNLADRPTAIFSASDLMAFGAYEAIRQRGLSIPDDISIIGFDDIPQALIAYPKLTTVRQSLDQMGQVAVKVLLEQIENPERQSRRITLATQIQERESCRKYEGDSNRNH